MVTFSLKIFLIVSMEHDDNLLLTIPLINLDSFLYYDLLFSSQEYKYDFFDKIEIFNRVNYYFILRIESFNDYFYD